MELFWLGEPEDIHILDGASDHDAIVCMTSLHDDLGWISSAQRLVKARLCCGLLTLGGWKLPIRTQQGVMVKWNTACQRRMRLLRYERQCHEWGRAEGGFWLPTTAGKARSLTLGLCSYKAVCMKLASNKWSPHSLGEKAALFPFQRLVCRFSTVFTGKGQICRMRPSAAGGPVLTIYSCLLGTRRAASCP